MAKKGKKLLKKLAKAALIGGVGYLAAKGLGKRGLKGATVEGARGANLRGILKAKMAGNLSSDLGASTYVTPKSPMPDDPRKWEVYQAKGGRVGKKGGGRTGKQFGGGLNRPVGGVGAPVRPLAYKHGGKVKSMGVAKRGEIGRAHV